MAILPLWKRPLPCSGSGDVFFPSFYPWLSKKWVFFYRGGGSHFALLRCYYIACALDRATNDFPRFLRSVVHIDNVNISKVSCKLADIAILCSVQGSA